MPMSSTHSEVYEKESEFREEHEAFWNTKADDFITPKSGNKAVWPDDNAVLCTFTVFLALI